ncbi:MAG: carbon-nitrogen hydrolase family protein [Clostridia bacterium]|nr:carbon-nitrogen hydrolase family protein [Clostridia bacterium]
MGKVLNIASIQLAQKATKPETYAHIRALLASVPDGAADLVMLPEMWNGPYEAKRFPDFAEPEGGPSRQFLSALAKERHVYLCGGSIAEREGDRVYNTAYVFDPDGRQIAKHRKMHLFDIDVKGGQRFFESDTLSPGNSVTVFSTPFCKMGLCICYDFRFPELAWLMVDAGAKMILVPAAFNMTTGPAHWELLFRQRAVDNQVYTVGVAPARDPAASYQSWGHSIVCSPWGEVLMQADEKESVAITSLDLDRVDEIRRQLPLLLQRRTDVYRLERIEP